MEYLSEIFTIQQITHAGTVFSRVRMDSQEIRTAYCDDVHFAMKPFLRLSGGVSSC